jgi:hypothetical protein
VPDVSANLVMLPTNTVVDATALSLDHEPLPAASPSEPPATAGAVSLHERAEQVTDVGVWEMTPGVTHDVEAHELLVVLSGRATIAFEAGGSVELVPGSVMRFEPGSGTTWTVHETLRKVYLMLA